MPTRSGISRSIWFAPASADIEKNPREGGAHVVAGHKEQHVGPFARLSSHISLSQPCGCVGDRHFFFPLLDLVELPVADRPKKRNSSQAGFVLRQLKNQGRRMDQTSVASFVGLELMELLHGLRPSG